MSFIFWNCPACGAEGREHVSSPFEAENIKREAEALNLVVEINA